VVELTVELAREMLRLAGKTDVDVEAALADGRAMDKWRDVIRAQGGDPEAPLPVARETTSSPQTATVCSSSSRRCRSGSVHGASVPVAPASRTLCSTPQASTCTRSRGTSSSRASRCSP
jgi:hypothetical protein